MFFRKLAAFIKKDFLIQISYRFSFMLNCMGLFIWVAIFYFIARMIGKGMNPYLKEYNADYFSFVLIGLAFYGYFFIALKAFSTSIREEQMMGTLEAIFLTPTKTAAVIIGMSFSDFIFTSSNAFICLFLGVFFLGVKLTGVNLGAIFVILALTVVFSSSIGIISAAFIMLFKRGDPITWLISLFSGFFGGVYFPISILPNKLQFISQLLPITYALSALRHALLQGYSLKMLSSDIVILLFFTLVLFPLSIFIFKYAVERVKTEGSLAHY